MGTLLMEAVARMQKLSADQPAQQRLSKVKLLCAKPLSWNYMRWNQDKQCYEATDATPSPHDQAIKAGQMLTEHMVKDGVLHAFHAMGGYVDGQGQSHNVQAHTLAGRPSAEPNQGSATSVVGLSSAQIDRSKTATGQKPSTPSQRPLADAAGRGSMIAKNGKGEPRSAQRKCQADEKGDRTRQQVTELLLYSLLLPWRLQIPTTCATLNSLVQACVWMYSVGASARNADFGDLRPLLRPLLNSTGTVQLHRKAWLDVTRAWANMHQQQTYLTRRLNGAPRQNTPTRQTVCPCYSPMCCKLVNTHRVATDTPTHRGREAGLKVLNGSRAPACTLLRTGQNPRQDLFATFHFTRFTQGAPSI